MKKGLLFSALFLVLLYGTMFYLARPSQNTVVEDLGKPPAGLSALDVMDHYYSGVGDTRNYYTEINNPKNKIANPLIIITGLEDITENWWPTAQQALAFGFQRIYIVEIRGQGRSQRVPGNSNTSAHIRYFTNYTQDILLALKEIDKTSGRPEKPPFVIAHSTGTLVYTASLPKIRRHLPAWEPEKISLWTPLVRPKISPLVNNSVVKPLLRVFESLASTLGLTLLGKRFYPRPFSENKLTSDPEKHKWSEGLRYSQKLNSSGVSLRWALEVFSAADQMRTDNYKVLSQPVLIFKAENDQVVRNDWKIDHPLVEVVEIKSAQHGLHIEKDSIFQEVINRTFQFFLGK